MVKSLVFDLGGILVPEAKAEIGKGVADFLGIKSHDLDARTRDLSPRVKTGELTLRDYYELVLSRLQVAGHTPEGAVERHLEIYKQHSSAMDSQVLELIEGLRGRDYIVASATNTEREVYALSSRK